MGIDTEKILNEHEHKLYLQTYKLAWNEAIEAAAKCFENNIDDKGLTSDTIRKLKK